MPEHEAQPGPGFPLKPPDQIHEPGDEQLLFLARELELSPALGKPDLVTIGDQLEGEQHGDDFEHMGHAASRQRQRRDSEQEHEQDGEALLAEELDQAPEGLVAAPAQPALELVADSFRLVIRVTAGWRWI